MSSTGSIGIQSQNNNLIQNGIWNISKGELFQIQEFDRDTYEKDGSLKALNCENYPNYQNQIKIGMAKFNRRGT